LLAAGLLLLATVSHVQAQLNLVQPNLPAPPPDNTPLKPKYCTIPSEFKTRLHLYQGCIASKAHDFEITGDSAESVAIAAVRACDDVKRHFEVYLDCEGNGVGAMTMQKSEKFFHDWAIQSVIEFRAKRVSGKQPEKSN
jgi:hypothetical protein